MNRRSFVKKSYFLGVAPAIPSIAYTEKKPSIRKRVFPKGLDKGDTIGLITPGSSLTRSAFEKTLSDLDSIGFKVKYSPNIRVKSGFLAGTDEQRVKDLHTMFQDSEVSAIICARGGYGCGRLLDRIDYEVIRQNPKPFIGYSDITALHTAFYKHTGLVCFHGPVGASEWNDFTLDYLVDIASKGKKVKISADPVQTIVAGEAEGPLIGGNLSLLASLIGTPHEPVLDDHILFLEEIGESVYRIDRMLTQLLSGGKLNKVAGIALGYFTDCDLLPEQTGYELSVGLVEVFKDRLSGLGVPVAFGFPFGHEPHNATLPIGVRARFDADKGQIHLLENAVL